MNIFLKFSFTLTIFFHFSVLSMEFDSDTNAFDQALLYFGQAKRLKAEAIDYPNGMQLNHDVEEAKQLHLVIDKLLTIESIKDNQGEPIDKKYASLLFKSAGRLLQLDCCPKELTKMKLACVQQPLCMLCLKKIRFEDEYEMAKSHWVSNSILGPKSICIEPENNQLLSSEKMTLPLLCKGKERRKNSGCEELLSQKGENDFCRHFLPFIQKVIEAKKNNTDKEFQLNYGPWLFHTISSLAYRVFLSDLENNENWLSNISRNSDYIGAEDSLWDFFLNLRQFILQANIGPKFSIKLYLSSDGIGENHELSLSHSIGSAQKLDGSAWYHWVLFSLKGFHFWVLSEAQIPPIFQFGENVFSHELNPANGEIIIKKEDIFSLPWLVQYQLEASERKIRERFGAFNLEIIKANLEKIKAVPEGKEVSIKALDFLITPLIIVRLPDGLKFFEPQKSDNDNEFRHGTIKILKQKEKVIKHKHFRSFTEEESAVWVFKHKPPKINKKKAKNKNNKKQKDNKNNTTYNFVIIQFPTFIEEGIKGIAVLGWKFDMQRMEENIKKIMNDIEKMSDNDYIDFSSITNLLEVLPGTDHTGIDFKTSKDEEYIDAPARLIFKTLLEKFPASI